MLKSYKGHVASIAIIILLGVAVVSFMFLAKDRINERTKEKTAEKFSLYLMEKMKEGIYRGCNNRSSTYMIESPSTLKISFENSSVCIEEICEEIIYCEFRGNDITIYPQKYEINFIAKNQSVEIEVKLWQ